MTVENMADVKRDFQRRDDPLEQMIRDKIKAHVYSTPQGKEMTQKAGQAEFIHLKDSIDHLDDPSYIHEKTQDLIRNLAEITNSRITYGEANLDKVPKGEPVFAILNHFSLHKLISYEQSDFGLSTDVIDDVPPPFIHFAAIWPVAERLEDNLYDAHLELPEPLRSVEEGAGLLIIPREGGNFETTLERTSEHIMKHPNSLTVLFPEGKTSGKGNKAGPFDMVDFHKGPFAIAANLGVPVLPTAQYFNPETGFEVGVFEPFRLDSNMSKEDFAEIAEKTRQTMQEWLNSKK